MEKIIDEKLLEHLLVLARLNLSSEKKRKILLDLEEILNYLKEIDNANTENIKPSLGASFQKNIFRVDIFDNKEKGDSDINCLKQAPELENGYFKVPRIKK